MSKKRLVKSDADQFEIDEKLVDEVANSDEFKDVELTNEDIMDAIQAIDALADAVIEKADAEEKELDADMLLDEVRDMIDETHEEEVELEEEEELPEELTNAAVRVMVSEDGEVELESTPDEIYDSEVDGLECTVYDTTNLPPIEVEEEGNPEGDDLLVIGNSKSGSFKKGFVKINNSVSKKAWSSAFQKVKKLVKSGKLTAAHWAIVSAMAEEEEEKDKLKKKLECALLKKIRSNKELKSKLLKSSEEINDLGQPIADTKPEDTVGEGNPGYQEEEKPTDAVSPEEVTSESGNPTEDPEKQVENDEVPVVEEEKVELEVFLANSKRKLVLNKILTNSSKKFSAYKVVNLDRKLYNALDGKVVKSGKNAYMFKDTANGLIACAAMYVDTGKGRYTTVLKNDRIVIAKGDETKVFNSIERAMNFKAIVNARKVANSGKQTVNDRKQELLNAHRRVVSKRIENSARKEVVEARRDAIRSKLEARREVARAKMLSSQNEAKLRAMHDNEERERLFQSSQNAMNEEKIMIKQGMSRNSSALDTMYKNMF